jgi:predicted nucleic acid-binding protein
VIRAVLDTNIAVASGKSSANSSPNREIISRWIQGQFKLLISRDIAAEYALKLRERGVDESTIVEFLTHLALLADIVEIKFFHFRHYPIDEDDIAFLLCAMNGSHPSCQLRPAPLRLGYLLPRDRHPTPHPISPRAKANT